MNIVITGSEGYVARNLIEKIAVKHRIYEFNSDSWNNPGEYGADWRSFLGSIPPKIDYVVHLGAIADSGHTDFDILQANTLATASIARGLPFGTRLIFFSSCAAIKPVTLYGWSKHLAEELVKSILVDREQYCILRPYNIYGGDESEKVNPSLVWKIKNLGALKVYSDFVRDFVHVDDVCKAVLYLIFCEWQPGIYDLGTGDPTTAIELYERLKGESPKDVVPRPEGIDPYLVASKSRMLKGVYCRKEYEDES